MSKKKAFDSATDLASKIAKTPAPVPEKEKSNAGRKPDPIKSERKRFTTMLNPDIKRRLLMLGHDKGLSIADCIEESVLKYLTDNGY